ncbi:KptA family-domain-containing protein [Macrophomina phaseolina]|uniref:2'-phosphotransferase n=1 Tax=Macrophomina phaseolina TaxID=35725 RepID=A0ABQ8G7H5_9PEZI|nr:KptA family-domain-containing protein [Macrophomina phaseolina]
MSHAPPSASKATTKFKPNSLTAIPLPHHQCARHRDRLRICINLCAAKFRLQYAQPDQATARLGNATKILTIHRLRSVTRGMSSRGRGGRGGGRGGRGPLPRDVQVSKKMSRILRHSAEDEGLKLGPGGYINVKDLLQTNTMKSLHVTFPELRAIVTSNDKQRFSLIPISEAPSSDPSTTTATSSNQSESTTADLTSSDDPSAYLIRANQGHSITSVDSASLLTPLTLDDDAAGLPALCVHGTTAAAWPRILASGGLKPMKRNHVHLAAGLPAGFAPLEAEEEEGGGGGGGGEKSETTEQKKGGEAAQGEGEEQAEKEQQPPVISGMRNTSRVLIYVDLRRALGAGIAFWRSANGVILTEGDDEKVLGVEFFKRVEDRKERKVLVRDGVVVGDGGVEAMKGEAEAADGKGRRGGRGGSGRGRGGWKDGRRGGAGEAF